MFCYTHKGKIFIVLWEYPPFHTSFTWIKIIYALIDNYLENIIYQYGLLFDIKRLLSRKKDFFYIKIDYQLILKNKTRFCRRITRYLQIIIIWLKSIFTPIKRFKSIFTPIKRKITFKPELLVKDLT